MYPYSMPDIVYIQPALHIRGTFIAPGDKSISHRALILASLTDGKCRIENLAPGDDVKATIDVLDRLGVKIRLGADARSAIVEGCSGRYLAPNGPLNCGNSGTTLRLVSGLLASQPYMATLTGDDSLKMRPVQQLADSLNQMGCNIETSPAGTPPLTIRGGPLTGITHNLKVPSAQIKSAIILAGLFARGTTVIRETLNTRDHTERLLGKLGGESVVEIDRLNRMVSVHGGSLPLKRFDIVIPGDASSAAFPIALATLLHDSSIKVPYVGINAGRTAFYRHLQLMGGRVVIEPDPRGTNPTGGEPVGEITASTSKLRNVPLDPDRIPAMIDELPLLAVISCLADGEWEMRDASRLRVKETDRVRTTAEVIRAVGGLVDEFEDGLSGPGGQMFKGGVVSSYNDHRIAMIAAVAAWCSKGPSIINGTNCVRISFPGFFERMQELVE
jgi:3-phosphoshikimate 1-carboxyvinyltransferase